MPLASSADGQKTTGPHQRRAVLPPCRDLVQLDISPVVTAVGSCRALLLAHGAPLPPAPTASPEEATPFLLRSVAAAGELAPAQLCCQEFFTYEAGLRFCEQQLLAVAGRYKLCRPPSEAIPLDQLLRSHARWVAGWRHRGSVGCRRAAALHAQLLPRRCRRLPTLHAAPPPAPAPCPAAKPRCRLPARTTAGRRRQRCCALAPCGASAREMCCGGRASPQMSCTLLSRGG